jgi:hypothetical protein
MFATGSLVYPRIGRRVWHDEACQAKQQRSRPWYGERGRPFAGVVAETDWLIVDDVVELASRPLSSALRSRARDATRHPHGEWRFAGSDAKRGASKWRCPSGECKPASRWVTDIRLRPLVPRETPCWQKLYKGRAAIEREFGRLRMSGGLLPLASVGLSGSS